MSLSWLATGYRGSIYIIETGKSGFLPLKELIVKYSQKPLFKDFRWRTVAPAMPSISSDCEHQRPGWRSPLLGCLMLSHIGPSSSSLCTGTKRTIQMDHTFFPGYRKTLVGPEEILLSIEIPYSREVNAMLESLLLLPGSRHGNQSWLQVENLSISQL